MENLKWTQLLGWLLALSTILVDWKGLPVINTLAYNKHSYITDVNSSIPMDPVLSLPLQLGFPVKRFLGNIPWRS